jgi:hypothetical protein
MGVQFSTARCGSYHIDEPHKQWRKNIWRKTIRYNTKLIGHFVERSIQNSNPSYRARNRAFDYINNVTDSHEGRFNNRPKYLALSKWWWNKTAKWSFQNNDL